MDVKRVIFLLVAMICSSVSWADCDQVSCVDVQVTRMYVTANGETIIGTSGDESQLSCEAGSQGYITLRTGQKNYNATYALILAAHASESLIWVRTVTSSTGSCDVLYVVSDK